MRIDVERCNSVLELFANLCATFCRNRSRLLLRWYVRPKLTHCVACLRVESSRLPTPLRALTRALVPFSTYQSNSAPHARKLTSYGLSTGGFFLIGGVLLFFDRSMLAMGNILFLIGLTIIIGPQKTLLFFARKQKAKGTAAFFAGLTLILLRWALIGFFVELYGIIILFGDFLGTIAGFATNIPVIGPYIALLVDRIGLGRRNAELPV